MVRSNNLDIQKVKNVFIRYDVFKFTILILFYSISIYIIIFIIVVLKCTLDNVFVNIINFFYYFILLNKPILLSLSIFLQDG
jgi:hypothetical protein